MQVKELEIAGFKSFVDRVKLSFQPGITALVGPNGCGKSNIMDAMRWIMGEHNARHLRGTKMDDLIFGGSETRKPTGMAEVSLVLTNVNGRNSGNGSGSGPHEMMVTRRLFRSGESEYFINKVPCRLKDIVELFLDSGIGSKSYSIMEQGKVDFILSLKPDERRILIEEAAGIAKYRTRKKEALSKMQSTRNNLNRLKDILAEIQLQMKGLDLQVKRLKRYRNLKEEIREIDLQVTAHRLRTLSVDSAALQTQRDSCRDDELSITTELSAAEASLENERLQLADLQKEVGQLQQDSYAVRNTVQTTESALQYNRRELQRTVESIARSEADIAEIEQSLQRLGQDRSSDTDRLASLTTEIESLEGHFRASTAALQQSRQALAELQQAATAESQALLRKTHEKTEIKNALLLNTRLQEEIERTIAKLETQRGECAQRLDRLQETLAQLERLTGELTAQRQTMQCDSERMRAEIASLSTELHERNEHIAAHRDRAGTIRARLQSLEDLQKNLEGYAKGVRAVMDAPPASVIGLLADMIRTEPQYETAVESALGRKLQAIVVQSGESGLSSVEFLRTAQAGRATFIPFGSGDCPPEAVLPGDCTPILSLITCSEEFRPMVSAMLGQVVVVESLTRALELRATGARSVTMVTPAGDMVEPDGSITGGSSDAAAAGILARNRQIREFSQQLAMLQQELTSLESVRDGIKFRLETVRDDSERLTAEMQALDLRLVQEQSRLDETVRRIAQERETAATLDMELQEQVSQRSRQLQERETLQEQLLACEGHEQTRRTALEAVQQREQAQRTALEQSEADHTDVRVRLAAMQQQHQHLQSTLERLSRQHQESHSKLEHVRQERNQLQEKTGTLEQQIEQDTQKAAELSAESARSEEALSRARQAVEECRQAVADREEKLKLLRARREEIEPRLHSIDLELSRLTVHLEHLEKELLDKYALSLQALPEPTEPGEFDEQERLDRLETLRKRLENIGEVNLGAAREHEELEKRLQFLTAQQDDLEQSIEALQKVIAKINRITRLKFQETYTQINTHFKELFPLLFNGGKAHMQLTDESDMLETGIEIFAQPPGKKLQSLDLLSGGERALTVIALMFSIFLTKPSPFCLMDEIDAPLDDSNIGRFIEHMHKMAERSQFIMVTHNKLSMQAANSLYGITMEERGVSKIVSVALHQPVAA